ncbi:MAG: ATP-binding protein [Pseudobdellovibrionaceae bacterium]
MYNRLLKMPLAKSKKSILLLGPRQVGKSTLIKSLKPDLEINLANEKEFFLFQTELSELERRIEASKARVVFVDEIQRIPRITNTIQVLLDENKGLKFYLTGSSARKLRKGKANLLPGRILSYSMSPLCLEELGGDWDEEHGMRFGFLPEVQGIKTDVDKKKYLQSYSHSYLKEEIMAEALVRQVDGFVRFLSAASLEAGRFLDFSKLSKKSKVPRQSGVRHFEILEDTLIASKVENDPDIDPEQVDLVKHPRFYFFDLGVLNALRGTFEFNKEREGFLFEHLVYNQIVNSAHAYDKTYSICNFRTRGGLEVDFILNMEGKKVAIECKSSESVGSDDIRSLRELDRYYKGLEKLVIYRGRRELKDGKIWILPLKKALQVLDLAQ